MPLAGVRRVRRNGARGSGAAVGAPVARIKRRLRTDHRREHQRMIQHDRQHVIVLRGAGAAQRHLLQQVGQLRGAQRGRAARDRQQRLGGGRHGERRHVSDRRPCKRHSRASQQAAPLALATNLPLLTCAAADTSTPNISHRRRHVGAGAAAGATAAGGKDVVPRAACGIAAHA